MPLDLIQLLVLLGMFYRLKSSNLGVLGIANEGMSMISANKTNYLNSNMKQEEMHEVTEYAIKFMPDQNIFKVPNKETISMTYAGNKRKKTYHSFKWPYARTFF